ncbi:MAG: hypothetical protein ABIY40_03095 [Rhodanobacteraceae bacterium]
MRVGLLLDDLIVPAWVAHIVNDIQASGFARVEFAVRDAERPQRISRSRGLRPRLRNVLYDVYAWLEVAQWRRPGSPFQPCDLTSALGNARLLHVAPVRDGDEQRISDADLQRIRAERPDVLLQFACEALRGEILSVPTYGVWSYHHGDGDAYRGEPALFWEIHDRDPVSGTELLRLGGEPAGDRVLYRSYGSTHPHSLELNRQAACWKASGFVMRCLRELAGSVTTTTTAPPKTSCAAIVRQTPGNVRMAQFLAHNVGHKARALIRNRVAVEQWSIAWRRGARLDPGAPRLRDMRELACTRGHYYADPILFRHADRDWLFLEDYDYARGKGDIVVVPWGTEGPTAAARRVLALPEHLSYPFVFEWEDQVYMMPQIGGAGGHVSLFRARRFPDDWGFVVDLLSGHRAVDATLHAHNGRWYLFVNICEAGGSANDELNLFDAETPLGPFRPHPQNPIVSDARRARPAGRLYVHDGRLIRPSQDCAGDYGRAVVFNEVLELSPDRYLERTLGRLSPDWAKGLVGCHTYAALGDLEVVDCKRWQSRWKVGA